jgi:hypothetical protein
MRLLHLIISGMFLATLCSADPTEEDTKIALHIDCTLLRFENHGQSLTLYVRGHFVQDSGPSKIPEDMLNSSDEKGISISARNTSDQKKLDLIRSQLKELHGGRLNIEMTSPVFMTRGGIAFFDLDNSTVTITTSKQK